MTTIVESPKRGAAARAYKRDPEEHAASARRAGQIRIQRRHPLRPIIRYRTAAEIAAEAKRKAIEAKR